MSRSRKKRSLWQKLIGLFKQVGSAFSDLSTALNSLITKPIRDLNRSLRGSSSGSSKDKAQQSAGLLGTLLRLPIILVVAVLSILFKVLISPGELLVGMFRRSTSMILWALPSIAILAGIYYLYSQDAYRKAEIQECFQTADQKFSLGSYQACIDNYSKLLDMEVALDDAAKFQLSKALHKVGRDPEAKKIFDELAPLPGDGIGYPPAHQLAAANIAKSAQKPISDEVRTDLKWHLDRGGESKSHEVDRAWAEYYLSINDKTAAIKFMEKAAIAQPEYMLLVISIYRDMDNQPAYRDALNRARTIFKNQVTQFPTLVDRRIILSNILVELGETTAAERTLLEGYDESKSSQLNTAIAAFYLQRYEANKASSKMGFDSKFDLLQKALAYDENYVPAYQSLIQLYREKNQDDAKRTKVITTLNQNIRNSKRPALAHFALSNLLWDQGEKAESRKHMEQAFELDPRKFAVVANNLAWILAHSEPPDLDRAYELSKKVCEKHPYDGRLRDTLARILMKQERYEQAIAEFSLALPTVTSKSSVHKEMADIYDKLGKRELAKRHREQVKK